LEREQPIEEDLEMVAVVVDGDSVVIAAKSVSERDLLLIEPGSVISTEDDLVDDATKVDVQ
jgi:hypothetical protein